MTKMYKAEIQGLGQNQFVPAGVWLTQEELDLVLERQYDDTKCGKVVNLGGKFFRPQDFRGVIETKKLPELLQDNGPLVDSDLLESLAKSGHLGEVVKNCPVGYKKFVDGLVESGKYLLSEGNEQVRRIG